MAGPKKTGGLGKGLDALFGNMEVAIEKKPVEVAEVIIKNDDRGKRIQIIRQLQEISHI